MVFDIINKPNIMKTDLTVYEKAEFLKSKGYKVGIAEGTKNYPSNVTKEGTQLNSSVNYAYNLEIKKNQ